MPRDYAPDGYHGTTTGYAYGCRCQECRRAAIAAQAKRNNAPIGFRSQAELDELLAHDHLGIEQEDY